MASLEAAVLRALDFYEFEDAAFLAELHHNEAGSEQSLFLLGTCRYRLGETLRAHHLLKSACPLSLPRARFLLARCCLDLKKYCEVAFAVGLQVEALSKFDEKTVAAIDEEFGQLAADVLLLLGKTSVQSGDSGAACAYFQACLDRNPLLWSAFEALCHHHQGQSGLEPSKMFSGVEAAISTVAGQEVTSAVTTGALRNPAAVQESIAFTPGAVLSSTPMEEPLLGAVPSSAAIAARRPGMNRRMLEMQQTDSLTPLSQSFTVCGQRAARQLDLEQSYITVESQKAVNVTPTESARQSVDNVKVKEQRSTAKRGRQRVTADTKTGPQASQTKQARGSAGAPGSVLRFPQPTLTPTSLSTTGRITTRSVTRLRQEQASAVEPQSTRKTGRGRRKEEAAVEPASVVNEPVVESVVDEPVEVPSTKLWQLGQLLQQLAVGHLALRKFDLVKAIKMFNSLPAKHRQSPWVREQVACAHFESSHYKEAIAEFEELRRTDPYSISSMPIFSSCLWHRREHVKLSWLANDLIENFRLRPETWCVAGNCLSLADQHMQAMALLKRAIQVDEKCSYAHVLMAEEQMMLEKPDFDAAAESFSRALSCDSRAYRAWGGLGRVLFQREHYTAAAVHFWNALKINPNCPVILVHVALVYKAMNNIKMSQQLLLKACRLMPDLLIAQFHLAALLACEGRFAESLFLLNRLKDQLPKEAAVFHLLAVVYQKQGDEVQSSIYLAKATDLDPKNAYLKVSLGRLLGNQSDTVEPEDPATPSFLSHQDASEANGSEGLVNESLLDGEEDIDDLSGFALAGVELSGRVSESINMSMSAG